FWIVEMDGQPVGLANLYDIDPAERAASWAYYLADPLVRGKGAGAVMGWLVIEQAFGPFGLERLSCVVLESNLASRRLCLSLGFASGGPAPLQQGKAGWTFSLSRKAWLETRETQRQRLAAKGFALS
ncbi:MAG: GNAT family N-acetyltransferase, partial [Caulobacteraceae bacterium]